MDKLTQKINQIKAELSSIVNGKSQKETKILESLLKIQDVHKNLSSLLEVHQELPILASRFKALDQIHRSAGEMTLRLQNIESICSSLATIVASNEAVLKNLKTVDIYLVSVSVMIIYHCCIEYVRV